MSSLNNIEKMLQIATIEQLYGMLQKMQSNNVQSNNAETNNLDNSTNNSFTTLLNEMQSNTKQLINNMLVVQQTQHSSFILMMNDLNSRFSKLEQRLEEIYSHNETNTTTNNNIVQINGQQKLTKYDGFIKSNKESLKEENIKLNIKELENNVHHEQVLEEELEEQQEVEEEEEEELEVEVEEELEEEQDELEEEEEEEVFEIEIDDVTYFATDENNGVLYEVDKDGDVGKKVGIIKDGEPIFI